MSLLVEDFKDSLDSINDSLTDLTVTDVNGLGGIEVLLAEIDKVLNQHDLQLDYTDIESVIDDWEEPTEMDGINVVFPIYDKLNNVTIYNMSLTYALASDIDGVYIVDAEVQYEWELDDEVETEYTDIDD